MIVVRRNELEPWVIGYHEAELDEVALALLDMFGAFPSMRQSGDEAAARIDSVRLLLKDEPAWSIIRVCERIRLRGYSGSDGKIERHWPPSDPEVAEAVRIQTSIYRDSFKSAVALLTAEVEND